MHHLICGNFESGSLHCTCPKSSSPVTTQNKRIPQNQSVLLTKNFHLRKMGTLSFSPLSISSPLNNRIIQNQFSLKTHSSNPLSLPKTTSINLLKSTKFCKKRVVLRSTPKDSFDSQFVDENGVVDDMDGYMNYLSLEYDSVWDTKPSWCQPWTIALTGVLAIAGSWVVLHSVIISGVVLSLISAWWYIFLYAYPKAYTNMIIERRQKVTNGVEDTFGR